MLAFKEFISKKVVFLFTLFLLLTIPATVFLALKRQEVRKKAVEPPTETLPTPLKPEYAPGEVLVKFKVQSPKLKIKEEKKAQGISLETQAVTLQDVEEQTLPSSLQRINERFPIKEIEKVFKGAGDPKVEIASFKARFPQRAAQIKPEAEVIDLSRTYKLTFDKETPVEQVIQELSQNPEIEYAEPNHVIKTQLVPNDPEFPKLWGLHNSGQTGGTNDADIDAPEAWDITTGDSSIVVGVIDTGIDYNHPDLISNIWTNPNEIIGDRNSDGCPGECNVDDDKDGLIDEDSGGCGSNGRNIDGNICTYLDDMDSDDEENGYKDDIRGWDFINNDNDPIDDAGHGTHVAGTIGAIANNDRGVTGVAWSVKLMPLKFLGSDGRGFWDNAATAIVYATDMDARLTNNSWGGGGYSQTLYDAISYANSVGSLFIAAAGNGGFDGIGDNNDKYPHYPSSYDLPNIIAVAATDHNDNLTSFSNYGLLSVDLAAPGKSIFSTNRNNQYRFLSGTSMATPHVSGTAALVWSKYPLDQAEAIKLKLLKNVDVLPQLLNKIATGGRLNAYKSVTNSTVYPTSTPAPTLPATATPTPTYTPTPTLTPTITPTPTPPIGGPPTETPTPTLIPTATPTPEL